MIDHLCLHLLKAATCAFAFAAPYFALISLDDITSGEKVGIATVCMVFGVVCYKGWKTMTEKLLIEKDMRIQEKDAHIENLNKIIEDLKRDGR